MHFFCPSFYFGHLFIFFLCFFKLIPIFFTCLLSYGLQSILPPTKNNIHAHFSILGYKDEQLCIPGLSLLETILSGGDGGGVHKAHGWGKSMHHVELLGMRREPAWGLAREDRRGWRVRVGEALRPQAFAPND